MKDKKTKSKRINRKYPRKKTNKKSITKNKRSKRYQKRKRSIRKQKGGGEEKKERNNDIKIVKPLKNDPIVIRYMMLSHDVIEFLPTTRVFKENNIGHYLSMIKLEDLLNIVNKNTDYKKSPKIQQIFNYNSSYLVDKNKIIFKYSDIKCDNLLLKEKGEYILKKLFLHILNCNSGKRMKEIILKGGDDNDENEEDDESEKLSEKIDNMFDEYRSRYPYDNEEKWPDERLKEYVKGKIKQKEYEDRNYELQKKEIKLREDEYKRKEEERKKQEDKKNQEDQSKDDDPIKSKSVSEAPAPAPEPAAPVSAPAAAPVSEPAPTPAPISETAEKPVSEPSPAPIVEKKPEKEEILTTEENIEEVEEDLDETDDKIEEVDDDIDDIESDIDQMKSTQKEKEKSTIKKIEEIIDKKKREKNEREEQEIIEIEDSNKERFEKEKNLEIKKVGLEEYLNDNKIVNISKNEFAMYNVNWLNVCCGIEAYDELFELEVIERINERGIIIDSEDIVENIKKIFEDESEKELFYKMIKSRLLDCSEIKEPNIFQNIFSDTIGSFKDCDKREKDSILYMYNGYRSFLKRKLKVNINKLDRALILIFCETRQELLSRYIALEMLRQKQVESDNRSNVIEILDNIMEIDEAKIKENDKKLKEEEDKKHDKYRENEIEKVRKMNNMEILSKEKELKEKREEKEKLSDKKDKLEDKLEILEPEDISGLSYEERKEKFEEEINNIGNDDWGPFKRENRGVINGILDKFDNLAKKDKYSVNLQLTPDEEEALNAMKGGDNENVKKYELTKLHKDKLCKELENTKQLKMEHFDVINDC